MDVLEIERMLLDETAEPTDLPLSLLQSITQNFSSDQLIGCGGFAAVYKGSLQNGMVAVKKLDISLDMDEKIFNQEVQCLMKAKHKNVVRFLGYCADTQMKAAQYNGKFVMAGALNRLLCFEYVPNGSLGQYIADPSYGLEWRDRYQIIKGICEGLDYLHREHILHLDLKPANILLDGNMIPKIADFGLSRCFDENQSRASASKLFGTLGYLAPESIKSNNSTRQITFKLDIYSLGIIIMEMLTGGKGFLPVEKVIESWMNRWGTSVQDSELEQVKVCTEIGIECMDLDPAKRPVTWQIINRLDKTASAIRIGVANLTLAQAENSSSELQQGTPNLAGHPGLQKLTAEQITGASTEYLGKGTHGTVYKVILKDGTVLAAKMLMEKITRDGAEFEAALANINPHPNLLMLRAYYMETTTKVLFFDLMPKGNLYALLNADARRKTPVDWATRMAIAKGMARGLAHLHDVMGVVHGNLTSNNVLIDDDFTPKIADFGMPRLVTAAAGSDFVVRQCYRAPELSEPNVFGPNRATAKTDVYGLGIMLMEMLTGTFSFEPEWKQAFAFDTELTQADATAGGPKENELIDTLAVALMCIDGTPPRRPEAREVLKQLEKIRPGPLTVP